MFRDNLDEVCWFYCFLRAESPPRLRDIQMCEPGGDLSNTLGPTLRFDASSFRLGAGIPMYLYESDTHM